MVFEFVEGGKEEEYKNFCQKRSNRDAKRSRGLP